MTLDDPFEINMGSGDSIERDGAAGCIVTFCLQYTLHGRALRCAFCEGWLSICAAPHLKEALHKLADFSARLACMHARNDHAAASSIGQNTRSVFLEACD